MQLTMILRDLALLCIPVNSLRYTIAWEVSLPIVLAGHAAAGIACYAAISRLYPKIGTFAAWLFASCLGLTAALSLAALPIEMHRLRPFPVLHTFFVCYRWTDTLLAGGLLLATAFLSRFPSPLKKLPLNLFRHTALLAAYFTIYAVANFLPMVASKSVNTWRTSAACLLFIAWTFALSKHGEQTEEWPTIEPEVADWIMRRAEATEQLYQHAAAEMLRLQVRRSE